ncbi:MAG: M20 family metallo-hydrolase [Calditrichia bacterium]|nr:M20 family metallo-hydrolase [Calditrichia bacterium]
MNTNYNRVIEKVASLKDEMIDLQRTLTAIPALGPENGGEGEWDKTVLIKEIMQEIGIKNIIDVYAPDERAKNGVRPNIIGIIPGKNSDKTIWIMAHTDIVPPGDLSKWETDPYKVVEKDGILYGRGVEDNQQGLISSLYAVKALLVENVQPEYNVGLVYVADEETGSKYGLEYVLEKRGDLFKKDDIIVVPDAGEPDSSMIEIAEASILWIKFTTYGKQCHASTPQAGINAHLANAHLIVELSKLYCIFDEKDTTFNPPSSTFEPTKKEANVENINTIPGEDIFYMDCRILPHYTVDEVLQKIKLMVAEIEAKFKVKVKMEFPQKVEAPKPTPVDAEVVLKLQKAVKDIYNINARPMGIGGGTVAAEFRKFGYKAAVWSTLNDTCHQPNEHSVIRYMVNDAKVFAHLFLQE